jgi:hypothetical protein
MKRRVERTTMIGVSRRSAIFRPAGQTLSPWPGEVRPLYPTEGAEGELRRQVLETVGR